MNENDFGLAARAWLDDGPRRMSDHAVLSTLEEIHATRQRRVLRPAWKAAPVTSVFRMVTAAGLVLTIGVLTIAVVSRLSDRSSVGGPTPTPSPSSSATLAADFPELATTFVSPRYGFSVRHPDRAVVTPATNRWDLEHVSDVVETGLSAVFMGASIELPAPENGAPVQDGTSVATLDEWIDRVTEDQPTACRVPRSQQAAITIDGRSGRISECPNAIQATVVAGDRLYLFTMPHDRPDGRAVFDAFAATIRLSPETADDMPTPDTTFVSPTNGFSVRYFDRGGLEPAKDLWDPVDQPPLDPADSVGSDPDDGFDFIETGFGTGFWGASAAVPDGVSIDAWFDTDVARYVPEDCRVPRSQQAAITIDGRPGRIVECHEKVTASVAVDGRLYLFLVGHADRRTNGRVTFDAFAETIKLRPGDAAASPTSP